MRIALVHDWLTNMGGAERVLIALHQLFPKAPIFSSVYTPEVFPELADADVRTTFIQRLPFARSKHQAFPLLRSLAFDRLDLSGFDVVITSCHAECKAVRTGPATLHICYCYTPIRYYWSDYDHYLENPRFGLLNPAVKALLPRILSRMQSWDLAAASRVDRFVGISNCVSDRIERFYGRESSVIYPPVDTSWLHPRDGYGEHFLLVGRLVPYKRPDLAVQAFTRLGWPLKVIGTGSELDRLKTLAGPTVQFLGRLDDTQLSKHYASCRALVFPQFEDFGIIPLEAMAAGRPVVAYRGGGAVETVVEDATGVFFEEQSVDSLIDALLRFDADKFEPARLRAHAERFAKERFQREVAALVETEYARFKNGNGATPGRR
ncbi:MAG: glycosyltransferase [Candidatus Geothermincolia bacterium]